MILRINGNPVLDKVNEWADGIIQTEGEWVFKPILHLIESGLLQLGQLLNAYSVEIVTLGVVACGFGMMVAGVARWSGKFFVVMIGGIVWRLMLS